LSVGENEDPSGIAPIAAIRQLAESGKRDGGLRERKCWASKKITSPLSSPLLEERGFCIAILSFSFRRRSLEDEVKMIVNQKIIFET